MPKTKKVKTKLPKAKKVPKKRVARKAPVSRSEPSGKAISINISNNSSASGGGGGSSSTSSGSGDNFNSRTGLNKYQEQSEYRILAQIEKLKQSKESNNPVVNVTNNLPSQFIPKKEEDISQKSKKATSDVPQSSLGKSVLDELRARQNSTGGTPPVLPEPFVQPKQPSVKIKSERLPKAKPETIVLEPSAPEPLPSIIPENRDYEIHIPKQFRKLKVPVSRPGLPGNFQPPPVLSIQDVARGGPIIEEPEDEPQENRVVIYQPKSSDVPKRQPKKRNIDSVKQERRTQNNNESLVKKQIEIWNRRNDQTRKERDEELKDAQAKSTRVLKRIDRRKKNDQLMVLPDSDDERVGLGKRDVPTKKEPSASKKPRKTRDV